MENYIKVNVQEYVKKGLEDGTMVPFEAFKYKNVLAVQGTVGDEVISWSADSEGNEIKEKVSHVELDPKTNQPGWVLTKLDENDEVMLDNNNHPNQWIVGDSKFRAKYEATNDTNIFKPAGGAQTFVKIPDNIILHQWGEEMTIAAGGYINITDFDKMYGISERDFNDTYKPISPSSFSR